MPAYAQWFHPSGRVFSIVKRHFYVRRSIDESFESGTPNFFDKSFSSSTSTQLRSCFSAHACLGVKGQLWSTGVLPLEEMTKKMRGAVDIHPEEASLGGKVHPVRTGRGKKRTDIPYTDRVPAKPPSKREEEDTSAS
jgi:hypothetical protein